MSEVAVDFEAEAVDVGAKEIKLRVPQLQRNFCRFLNGLDAAAAVAAMAEEGLELTELEATQLALQVREDSQTECFFCEVPTVHKTAWLTMSLRELGSVACRCNDKYRGSRKTYYPNWERKLEDIVLKVHSGKIPEGTPLYTDLCIEPSCGKPFVVTAKNAVIGWTTSGRFHGWTRCHGCVQKVKRKALRAGPRGPATPALPAGGDAAAWRTSRGKNALAHRMDLGPIHAQLASLEALLKGG